MAINFEKFAAEGNEFINELSRNLGHEQEKGQVGILLRAVLHKLRDYLSIPQSLNLISQFPMFLKALYVEQWKDSEKFDRIKTLKEFAQKVEEEQARFGEKQFDWNEPTIDLVKTVLNTLYQKYLTQGQVEHLMAELPAELKSLFAKEIKASV